MRQRLLLMLLVLLIPLGLLHAQRAVYLGGHRFVPEQNEGRGLLGQQSGARTGKQGASSTALGGGALQNVLIQFKELPTPAQVAQLARQGITLGDYVGGYAYWALIQPNASYQASPRGVRIASVVAVKPEWKLAPAIQAADIPPYARVGSGGVRVVVGYAENATAAQVQAAFQQIGTNVVWVDDYFRAATVELPLTKAVELASFPWVLAVNLAPAPEELFNSTGRMLGRANLLSVPAALGGRALTGKGVKIGIWDANVVHHVDFGDRIHSQETESANPHGTHVTGTVLGAGMLDPDAQGMAPKAEAWTYNFGTQRNGLITQQEMVEARREFGITLTQNSYGRSIRNLCTNLTKFTYTATDRNLDLIMSRIPTLTHIFAAGNDGGNCGTELANLWGAERYGSATNRSKNSIHVGAVDANGMMSSFSSWGPQDDGRMFPTVCAKGVEVHSTLPGNAYGVMDGTSMACPTVTGHAALLSERYAQLNPGTEIPSALLRGVLANTATDAGRPGPDFQYGYGIMNAERAAMAIENGWYAHGQVAKGEAKTHTIALPAGCAGVRIMLVWNDPEAQRAPAFGQRALVNDLNLSLQIGSTTYYPWVCDHTKGNVEKAAERKVDSINNIEQITLTAAELKGLTSVEVLVNGKVVPKGSQSYIITWYFETDAIRLVSPADGQPTVPGEKAYVAVENIVPPASIELSYDGGISWLGVGVLNDGRKNTAGEVLIPANAPLVANALMRVVDAEGRVAKSARPFTIAPRVELDSVAPVSCGAAGVELKWQRVDAAVHGYEVLLGDPSTGIFTSIGHTASADQVSYTIPVEKFARIEQPVAAVAVRLPDGSLGKRSLGKLLIKSLPVQVVGEELPFVESFVEYPSRYFTPEVGKNMRWKYVNSVQSFVPPASNLFGFVCYQNAGVEFDTVDYFNSAKNAANMGTLRMCELDLTGLQPDERVLFHFIGVPSSKSELRPSGARMRVLAGEDGQEVLTSFEGVSVYTSEVGHLVDTYYELKPGVKHRLSIQFSCANDDGVLAIAQLSVERHPVDRLVELSFAKVPANAHIEGDGEFEVNILNRSAEPIENLPVKVYSRGKWVSTVVVPAIQPLGTAKISASVDLHTDSVLGEPIPVRFECQADPGHPKTYRAIEHTVISMGPVISMGNSEMVNTILGPMVQDPKLTYTIDKPTLFTDNGGVFVNYTQQQESTLKFLPADPNMKVRVRFTRFKSNASGGLLGVITADVPGDLNLKGVAIRYVLGGEEIVEGVPSKTFVSEAADGGITFLFKSDANAETDEGWLAEVDLVAPKNIFALTGLRAVKHENEVKAETRVPVEITVRNLWNQKQNRVIANRLNEKNELVAAETIDLEPGEHTITLAGGVRLKPATPTLIQITLEGDDTKASDNRLSTYAIYDRYCVPSRVPLPEAEKVYLSAVRAYGKSLELSDKKTGAMRYSLTNDLKLYKGDGQCTVTVSTVGKIPQGWSLAAWVDWNDNGEFEPNEREIRQLAAGVNASTEFVYNTASQTPGIKRIRLQLGKTDELPTDACGSLENGDIQDAQLELVEGIYPHRGDLRLRQIYAGRSGKNLKADQKVEIEVSNESDLEFTGNIRFRLTVDGAPATEEVVKIETPIAPFSGMQKVALASTADLHTAGLHTVKVELYEDPVVQPENNSLTDTLYCTVPEPNGLYALDFRSQAKEDEYVVDYAASEALGQPDVTEWTMDMVFRIDRPKFGALLATAGLEVYTTYHTSGAPDNAIALLIGQSRSIFTPQNSITPGKWHHLTIAFDKITGGYFARSRAHVYIDGVECLSEAEAQSGAPSFETAVGMVTLVGVKFDGEIKLFRAASKRLAPSEIRTFEYVRQADGTLPAPYVAEYSFDEGPKSKLVFSGNDPAEIIVPRWDRIAQKEDGIWKRIDDLIATFQFGGQTRLEKAGENAYTITFEEGTELHSVVGSISTTWPNVSTLYKGAPITSSTRFDFTQDVVIEARANLFGHAGLTQTITLKSQPPASGACELLSLSLDADKNPGLGQSVVAPTGSQTCRLVLAADAPKPSDPSRAKLTYTISPDAQLFCGQREMVNGIAELDLTQPCVITVKAPNGNVKNYEVALAYGQKVEWEVAKTTYTYGDAPVELGVKASSGLPVSVTSSNPEVATVAGGKLFLVGAGQTTLTARQDGGGLWDAAPGVEATVTVAKRPATVKVAPQEVELGPAVELEFEYGNLATEADLWDMPDPLQQECYTLLNADGQPVDLSLPLQLGVYTLKADAGKVYETPHYVITPKDGQFSVVQGEVWPVTITVTDGSNPLGGIVVTLEQEEMVTPASGTLVWYLPQGKRYTFSAAKSGCSTVTTTVDLLSGGNKHATLTLRPATLTLTYGVAAGNGSIVGLNPQQLSPSADGEPVMAVPAEGYYFKGWSDGSTENPHVEKGIALSKEIMATFAHQMFRLHYQAGEGGTIAGNANQEVGYNADGQEVVATPNAGHYFQSWSDGVTEPKRTDKEVKDSVNVTALFAPFATLPDGNDFESRQFDRGWYTVSVGQSYDPWYITNLVQAKVSPIDGYSAVCNSDKMGMGAWVESYLYSPIYLLPAGWNSKVLVSADYAFKMIRYDTLKLQYRVNEEEWKDLLALLFLDRQGKRSDTIDRALAGGDRLQLRWMYKTAWSYAAMLDNIAITPIVSTPVTITYKAEPSEGGKIWQLDASGSKTVELGSQSVPQGKRTARVEAEPAPGYRFIRWDNGSTNQQLDSAYAFMDATRTAYFERDDQVIVTYQSLPPEGGAIQLDGVATSRQAVTTGQPPKPVTAVPSAGYKFAYWGDNGDTVQTHQMQPISENVTLVVAFEQIVMQAATLTVVDTLGSPIAGATIELAAREYSTTAAGEVAVVLETGDYPYTVRKAGYAEFQGSLHVLRSIPTGERIVLREASRYPFTFTVTADGKPVRRARVEVEGQPQHRTDTEGVVSLKLLVGQYHYTVQARGYKDASGIITVQENGGHESVTLSRTQVNPVEGLESLASVQCTPNPFTESITLAGVGRAERVYLVDATGRVVYDAAVQGEDRLVLQLGHLPSGIYLLVVEAQGHRKTLEVCKH